MTNIAVLVSGGGTNLQALIDAQAAGKIENGSIRLVRWAVASDPERHLVIRRETLNGPVALEEYG